MCRPGCDRAGDADGVTGPDAPPTDHSGGATWALLPGAPESRLSAEVAACLPAVTPAPPWRTRVEATLWWHPAGAEALAALPAVLRPRRALVVGAVVRYLDSPVGPYAEVLGAVVPGLLRVHVPFLAVDRLASVAGGRAHWALPKALATALTCGGEVTARGEDWSVGVASAPRGPRLPVGGWLRLAQLDDRGRVLRAGVRAWGRARAACVTVDVRSAYDRERGSIAGLLRGGRHPGAVLQARVRIGPPR